MSKMIHYQDDLFALSVLIKSLDLMLATEADPEYFGQRVDTDIRFISQNLASFAKLLDQNSLLIERPECLKLLQRNVKALLGILERLESAAYPHAESFSASLSHLKEIEGEQRSLLATLNENLKSSLSDDMETDIVSQDEMSELLRG